MDLVDQAVAEFRQYVAFNRQAEAAFERYWALWRQIPARSQLFLGAKIKELYAGVTDTDQGITDERKESD